MPKKIKGARECPRLDDGQLHAREQDPKNIAWVLGETMRGAAKNHGFEWI